MKLQKFILFKQPELEEYEGRKIFTDPGVHAAVAKEITRLVPKGSNLLDIGAGAGAMSLRLHRAGFTVQAVDVDDSRFDIPEIPITKINPDDRLSTILGAERFDAITAIEVIEHVYSTKCFLDEAYSLLKPGGRLFVTTPNLSSIYSRIVFLKEGRFYHFQGNDSLEEIGHVNPVPYFILEHFAAKAGFREVFRQGLGVMPVIDWSNFNLLSPLTAAVRTFLYSLMVGPGPVEGNNLFYCLEK